MKTDFKGTKSERVIKNTVTSSVYGVEKKAIFPENKQGFYDKSICHIDCNNQYGLSEHEANAKLISCAPELLEALQGAKQTISRLKNSIIAHPDCLKGSEFEDYANLANEQENKIEELIKKATTI